MPVQAGLRFPNGDLHGRPVPLLRDVATELGLASRFPDGLRDLAGSDFEAAYSRLHDRDPELTQEIDEQVRAYFAELELPTEATIYDALLLSLRDQGRSVHVQLGSVPVPGAPSASSRRSTQRFAPNRLVPPRQRGRRFCGEHEQVRGIPGSSCWHCGKTLLSGRLLFPVEHKDYQDGSMIEREWEAAQGYLPHAFMLTVFGYSAPETESRPSSF